MEQRIHCRQTPIGILYHQWVCRKQGDVERQASIPEEQVPHLDTIAGMGGMIAAFATKGPLVRRTEQHQISRGEALRRTRHENVACGTLVADGTQDAQAGDVASPSDTEPCWHGG